MTSWWRARAKKHTGWIYFQSTEHMSGTLAAVKIFGSRYYNLENLDHAPNVQTMGVANGVPIYAEKF